jgi:excisionase family DNA binding protein
MKDLILSTIPIPDLIDQIVEKMQARITDTQPANPPLPFPDTRLYGDKAAANHIGCTVQTIIAMRKRGEIPFYRYGRKYFYKANEIDSALKVEGRRFGELRGKRGSK